MFNQNPQRTIRHFIRDFGRVHLSELFVQLKEGVDEQSILDQYSLTEQQLNNIKSILLQSPQKRKLG
ncbi:MAG: hypothetical protein CL916_04340 [Deltaproteobacteria bacterium]|nr:hypothetical protein [Deltaproteobacteria bacterium]